jgi:uncharacterized protein YlzI (FlbEa/FlbD family)
MGKEITMASSFIKLTHVFDKKQTPVYVNVDQICRVGEAIGGGKGLATTILLANGQADVVESVEEVMGLIREIPSA